jgi:type I restriction enzyme S subunit
MTFLYKEADFKETSIGKIPKDWEIVNVGDILSLEYGKGLPERERISGEYPVVGSNGIVGYHNKALIKGPGIVIGRKGTIGAVSWVERDFWPIDTTYFVKLKKDGVDLKWLYYVLIKLDLPKLHLSDVVPGLKREIAYSLKIPFPSSLKEQRAVAGILGVVDSVIAKTDEVIAKTERLKKGLMQTLLTRGIGHREFKETEIGKIPKTWQVVRVSSIGQIFTGKTPSTQKDEYWNGDIPFITPADIRESKYVYETERHVTSKGAEQSIILPKDTVLTVCIGSTIGKVALTYKESVTNQQINAIICDKGKADPHYVYYAVLFRAHLIKSLSGVAAVPIVKKSLFEQFKIPMPPLLEQKKIAEILSLVDNKLELERNGKVRLERIKQGLMDLLLTGKIRVRVD